MIDEISVKMNKEFTTFSAFSNISEKNPNPRVFVVVQFLA